MYKIFWSINSSFQKHQIDIKKKIGLVPITNLLCQRLRSHFSGRSWFWKVHIYIYLFRVDCAVAVRVCVCVYVYLNLYLARPIYTHKHYTHSLTHPHTHTRTPIIFGRGISNWIELKCYEIKLSTRNKPNRRMIVAWINVCHFYCSFKEVKCKKKPNTDHSL